MTLFFFTLRKYLDALGCIPAPDGLSLLRASATGSALDFKLVPLTGLIDSGCGGFMHICELTTI